MTLLARRVDKPYARNQAAAGPRQKVEPPAVQAGRAIDDRESQP